MDDEDSTKLKVKIFTGPRGILKRLKEYPSIAAGLTGMTGVFLFSVYHYFKKPGDMRPSTYFLQSSVLAQLVFGAALTGAACYHIYQNIDDRPRVILSHEGRARLNPPAK